ncbi:MAG: DUF2225 domain-containing protein [Clostridiales bacterium]|jgi:uncharacterized protein (DUF2225 family)|nr:DUF2225 domain-containing protein [Clostridiales bacterium]
MDIQMLMKNSKAKKFPSGHVIIREGNKMGNEMYVILQGSVDVIKNYQMENEIIISSLSAGNFFGEMTLFLNKERGATVIAKSDVTLFVIERDAAYKFFETQPQLTYLIVKTLCKRLEESNQALANAKVPGFSADGNHPNKMQTEKLFTAPAPKPVESAKPAASVAPASSAVSAAAWAAASASSGFISDTPPPGFISDIPPNASALPPDLFPEGHKLYEIPPQPVPDDLVYKKNFKCPVCEKAFPGYSVRTTRLKVESRDPDFRNIYKSIDTTYFEIVTCPDCYFSMFDASYAQPIISRLKENIKEITPFKYQLQMDIVNDRNINNVFAGYFLALKGAPLFYKSYEMFAAKIWLRLKWLYADAKDKEMEEFAAKNAHQAYLAAFEKTDASPEAIQQLCVLMGELSLIVKDMPNAKLFFVKARSNRNGSKALLSQAEDGIEKIRKIESGPLQF